jgi:hypothetical protein
MLSKIARAYKKAGTVKGGGTEADHEAFAFTLLNAGVVPREKQQPHSESHQRRNRNRGPKSQRSPFREESCPQKDSYQTHLRAVDFGGYPSATQIPIILWPQPTFLPRKSLTMS